MTGKKLPQDYPKYYAIQDAIASGKTMRQVCKDLHVDFRTVKKYFPNAGGAKGGGNGKVSENPERLRRIGLMVADGASLNEIARTEHTDPRTIKKYFPKAGWGSPGGVGSALMKKARDVL